MRRDDRVDRARTMQHQEGSLTDAGIELSGEVLDRIEEIVPAGSEINSADNCYAPHVITDKRLRRRRTRGLRSAPSAASRLRYLSRRQRALCSSVGWVNAASVRSQICCAMG